MHDISPPLVLHPWRALLRAKQTKEGILMKNLIITSDTKSNNGQDLHILRLEGRVDDHTLMEFKEELAQLVEHGQYNLLLDLEKVAYINPTGLELLLSTFRQVRRHEGDLLIAKMNPKMKSIFHVLGFNHVIRECDDYEEGFVTGH
jgi:anti-sigma B factor antagonist